MQIETYNTGFQMQIPPGTECATKDGNIYDC